MQVLRGVAVFLPDGGRPFTVGQEYIITRDAGQTRLFVHWIDLFVCPWYRTFDEALAANPTFDSRLHVRLTAPAAGAIDGRGSVRDRAQVGRDAVDLAGLRVATRGDDQALLAV